MQFAGFRPSLQRNALKRPAARTNAAGTAGKRLGPGLPLFSVEFLQDLPGVDFESVFLALGMGQELLDYWIICRS